MFPIPRFNQTMNIPQMPKFNGTDIPLNSSNLGNLTLARLAAIYRPVVVMFQNQTQQKPFEQNSSLQNGSLPTPPLPKDLKFFNPFQNWPRDPMGMPIQLFNWSAAINKTAQQELQTASGTTSGPQTEKNPENMPPVRHNQTDKRPYLLVLLMPTMRMENVTQNLPSDLNDTMPADAPLQGSDTPSQFRVHHQGFISILPMTAPQNKSAEEKVIPVASSGQYLNKDGVRQQSYDKSQGGKLVYKENQQGSRTTASKGSEDEPECKGRNVLLAFTDTRATTARRLLTSTATEVSLAVETVGFSSTKASFSASLAASVSAMTTILMSMMFF